MLGGGGGELGGIVGEGGFGAGIVGEGGGSPGRGLPGTGGMMCGPGLSPGPGLLGFPGEPATGERYTAGLFRKPVPLLFSFMADLCLSKGSESFGGHPRYVKNY
jgi:hypothetical protein